MSQIGNEKGGLEMIGRLLGGVDGKAGRMAAKLGGGASQEFARLMASAQGRMNGAQASPQGERSLAAGTGSEGGAALSPQLQSALTALGEEMARLRQRLASDASAQAPVGNGDQDVRAMLARMVETLSPSDAPQAVGKAPGADNGLARGESVGRDGRASSPSQQADALSNRGQSSADLLESAMPAAPEAGEAAGTPDELALGEMPARSPSLERLARDETVAAEVAELAEALADWRQALDAGVPAQTEVAADALRDRLAALRESMQEAGVGRGDQSAGLIGQLQALQQLMARAETTRAAEPAGARGASEPRAWSEWSWRLAGGGQGGSSARSTAAGAAGAVAVGGENADWNGGPVTAALGLAGREVPAQPRNERPSPMHWSSMGAVGAQSADPSAEMLTSSGGLGPSSAPPSSSMSSGSAAGGIFTGQSATPAPNPQMPAQLGQQIQWMVGKGQSRAQIELRPADLGPLKISIETQGDETRIALTATNATTQGLLEQQLPRLKEWLQESGLANSEVDVSLGQEGDFDQQLADADGDEPDSGGGFSGDAEMTAATTATDSAAGEVDWIEGRAVLDLFA